MRAYLTHVVHQTRAMENMCIINKIPKDKDFVLQLISENTNKFKRNRGEINFCKFNSTNDLSNEDWKHNQILDYILDLNDKDFWNLINVRLSLSIFDLQNETTLNDTDIEYWTTEHIIDELFLQIAKKREIINYKDKKITIYKYYHQALRMWKWIPISKPKANFIVNISDLTSRIYCELRNLDKYTAQYVLKESAKRIFENIDFKFYHEHIEDNLEVTLDK